MFSRVTKAYKQIRDKIWFQRTRGEPISNRRQAHLTGLIKLATCLGCKQPSAVSTSRLSTPTQSPTLLPANRREFHEESQQEQSEIHEIQEHHGSGSSIQEHHGSGSSSAPKTKKKKWRNPPPRTIRIDTDASWSLLLNAWFTSVIVRDTLGSILESWIFVKKENLEVGVSFEGEVYGVDQAIISLLNWSELRNYEGIWVATDSKDVVEHMNSGEDHEYQYRSINFEKRFKEELETTRDHWEQLKGICPVEIMHTGRTESKAAHELAKFARRQAEKSHGEGKIDEVWRTGRGSFTREEIEGIKSVQNCIVFDKP